MKILVDTSIWSIVLRRKNLDVKAIRSFNDILENEEIFVTGIIIQELLSHIKNVDLYDEIRKIITGIGYIEPHIDDYLLASKTNNDLRRNGIITGTKD